MLTMFRRLYRAAKQSYLGERAGWIPEKYWSQFVCLGSASDWHYLLSRVVPKSKKRVLVVGVHGGRDYFYFKSAGHEVVGQDLFPDDDFGEVIIGNIEDVQIPEKSFDVVVASAVIEHVADDFAALKNIRRILKDDGIFILCFSLYNDWEITHLHIYSGESMKRLVKSAGFSVRQSFGYPNLFFYPPLVNIPLHGFNALLFAMTHGTVYQYILPPLWRLEFFLSRQHTWLFRAFRYVSGKFHNGNLLTFVCGKDEVFSHLDHNKGRFQPHD